MTSTSIIPQTSDPRDAPAAPLPDTFREWLITNLGEELPDVAQAVDSGFAGLTYYTDTVALYAKYQDEIWAHLRNVCECHDQTPLEFIASFGGAKNVECDATFANLLVWYMAERLALEIVNEREDSDDAE